MFLRREEVHPGKTNIRWADTLFGMPAVCGKCRKIIIIFVDISKKMRIIGNCMDTQKSIKDGYGDLLDKLRSSKVIVGAKQIRKAVNSQRVSWVFLARNADYVLTEALEARCLENSIPCVWVPNMTELGQACGIEVGAAAAAIVD